MTEFVVIAEPEDIAIARVLVTALRAHGFHPLAGGEDGLPGMPGITGISGRFAIRVPEDEAGDARLLAGALIADMKAAAP